MIIDKDVPLPQDKKKRNVYPYKEMEIGDSFFVDNTKMQIVLNANYTAGKSQNKKFIARREGEGVRVWRTA